jgi:hypothetical protein
VAVHVAAFLTESLAVRAVASTTKWDTTFETAPTHPDLPRYSPCFTRVCIIYLGICVQKPKAAPHSEVMPGRERVKKSQAATPNGTPETGRSKHSHRSRRAPALFILAVAHPNSTTKIYVCV